ncbi:MAG: RDD family protein [Muribaculaceae bacterium]|nr:RDD family protein [Muribaculaceae bacterium]
MASTQIITGQYVTITQTPASVTERMAAQLIDILIITLYTSAMLYMLYLVNISSSLGKYDVWFYLFVYVLPPLLYQPVCERLNHGQSVGKMIMKTQVIMLDGSTPTLGAYAMRWALYWIDIMGMGLIFILFNKNNQRMGDLAAGTIVIKKSNPDKVKYLLNDQHFVSNDYKPTYPEAADLTLNQVELISRAFYNDQPNRTEMIVKLALKIQEHLGIDPMGMDPATFISVVSNDYYYYATTLEV